MKAFLILVLIFTAAGCDTVPPPGTGSSSEPGGAILAATEFVFELAGAIADRGAEKKLTVSRKLLASGNESEIRAAAAAAAGTNAMSGRWMIFYVFDPQEKIAGVPAEHQDWAMELPGWRLPEAPDPLAPQAKIYGEAYNQEFFRRLRTEEDVFHGHAEMGFEVSRFVPCGSRERWWIIATDSHTREMLWSVQHFPRQEGYAEVKGIVSAPGHYGHLNGYKRLLIIQDVLFVRPSSASDCK